MPRFVLSSLLLALLVLACSNQSSKDEKLTDFDALWNYGQPDSTEIAFRALLPAAVASGNADYLAQLHTQIARTQGLQRQFDAAHATLDETKQLLGDDTPVANIRYLLERGRVFNSSGEKEQAKPLFEEALAAAQDTHQDFYAVDAAHMIAIVEPPEQSLEWNLKAIAMAEASEDERAQGWLGSLYNNTGWSLHDMERYDEALAIFQKAQAWREARGQEPQTRIAKWCVARTLRSLERHEEALAMQQALHAELEELGEKDGYVYEELGECLLALGRGSEASPYFAEAYALLSQDAWLVDAEPERLERLKELGGVE